MKIHELIWPDDPVSWWQRVAGYGPAHDGKGEAVIQPLEKPMKAQRIPQIDSIEELARFWDTHDLTEFEVELEEVPEPVFERKPETVVRLRLHPQEAQAVQQLAKARGVERATLLRRWVREKLRESTPNVRFQRPRRQSARR